jgi:hypothetical protein
MAVLVNGLCFYTLPWILLVYSSATLHTPGGSPTANFPEAENYVYAPQTDRCRPRRYRPCRQGCLPQRKPLHADAYRVWEHL